MRWSHSRIRSRSSGSASRNGRAAGHRVRPSLEALDARILPSVSIQFDYSHDTSGFFNVQARKDVLQAAATDITSRLNDTLAAVPAPPSGADTWTAGFTDPTTGNPASIPN